MFGGVVMRMRMQTYSQVLRIFAYVQKRVGSSFAMRPKYVA